MRMALAGTPKEVRAPATDCARAKASDSAADCAAASVPVASPKPVIAMPPPPRRVASWRRALMEGRGTTAEPTANGTPTPRPSAPVPDNAVSDAARGVDAGGGAAAASAAVAGCAAIVVLGMAAAGRSGGTGADAGAPGRLAGAGGPEGKAGRSASGCSNALDCTPPTVARSVAMAGGELGGAVVASAPGKLALAPPGGGGAGGRADPRPNKPGAALGLEGSTNCTPAASCWALPRSAMSASAICWRNFGSDGAGRAGTVPRFGYGSSAPGGAGRSSAILPPCRPCHHSTGLSAAGTDEQPATPAPSTLASHAA